MKNKIMDYLMISSDDYDDKIFFTYWKWCSKYAQSSSQEQQLLANTAVDKWFMFEYTKRQERFIRIFDNPDDVRDLCIEQYYDDCINTIFSIYPKALIDQLKMNPMFKYNIKLNTPIFYAN